MVKMRLLRMGDKKNPIYRIVVVDSRKAMSGEYIDCVGHYRPTCEPIELTVDVEKAKDWISKGVQPTETGEKPARQDGCDGEIGQAQPFQDQGQEVQEIRFFKFFPRRRFRARKSPPRTAAGQITGGASCWIW